MTLSRDTLATLLATVGMAFVAMGPVAAQSGAGGGTSGSSTGASSGAATGVAPAAPASATPASPEAGAAPTAPVASGAAPAASAEAPQANSAQAATAATPDAATTVTADAEQAAQRRMQDACMAPPAKLTSDQVEAFLADPADLLATYGAQSVTLSNRVRTLAGSDGRTLDPIFANVNAASDDQKAAIGAGLGRAAFLCQGVNPDYAGEIQSRIADIDAPALLTAFLTATNDLQVAAIGGASTAGAAGAPGLSGGGLAGPGTAGLGGDDTTPNLITTYASGGGGGLLIGDDGGSSSSNITINIFGGTPVSPTSAN